MHLSYLLFAVACGLQLTKAEPRIVEYNWTVGEYKRAPDGFMRNMILANGQYPGPRIEVNHKDVIRVNVRNNLKEPTSLHWHGMLQTGTPWMDGVPGMTGCSIPPNSSYTYEFNTTGNWGTYYWHSHHSAQLADGLVGALIIRNDEEDPHIPDYDFEYDVIINDLYHSESPVIIKKLHEIGAIEAIPDNILINGRNTYDCDSADLEEGQECDSEADLSSFVFIPGRRYRLRIINAGSLSNMMFSIDNHKMTIIEADGTSMKKYTVDRLSVHIAQRYSVIVEANQEPQNYYMRAELDTECFHGNATELEGYKPALATIVYEDGEDTFEGSVAAKMMTPHCQDMNGQALVNYYPVPAPPYDDSLTLRIKFGRNGTRLRGFLNNQTYFHDGARPTMFNQWSGLSYLDSANFIHKVDAPKVVQIILQGGANGGEHPFHLHGHTFQIVGVGQGTFDSKKDEKNFNLENPTRRDVAVLPRKGWIAIRFVADNPGVWALHCHMDVSIFQQRWHLEAGLSMQFLSQPKEIMNFNIPEDTINLCSEMRYISARSSVLGGELRKAAFDTERKMIESSTRKTSETWDDRHWVEEGNVVADLRSLRRAKVIGVN
ncbi:hypothetical protein INT43_001263 [Umbelopsis isabellina]|uniref:Laccase n=1 Tax=Mortierella isabellina TaxID=91625 RepID=A0A8H7PKJ5_MORIS|nr:hypothetical protein INT43_001263 [Umbelopsis isabellina]